MSLFHQEHCKVPTKPRSIIDITAKINHIISTQSCQQGLCNLFITHTSASLIICENADPQVRKDLETFFRDLVPDGDKRFLHQDEGPDDMSAHIRTILTQNSLSIPIKEGRLMLGRWQGVYCYEHRAHHYERDIVVTLLG